MTIDDFQHFPIHDESAVKVVLKAIEFVKPDIFINLGDVGEWNAVDKSNNPERIW